jgi:dTMP kinase
MPRKPSRIRSPRRGLFITFEGIEGSGKSTQCARLVKRLRELGYDALETREPGGTPLAERIRTVLLAHPSGAAGGEQVLAGTEALLILAARMQHLAHVIKPALQQGALVVCDRFADSTLAYQGYGRGLGVTSLERLNRWVTGGLTPDLTLLFDCPVSTGLIRRQREADQNRLDHEAREFHERVRHGFLALAKRHPRRIRVLDGRGDPDAIAAQVEAIILKFLKRRKP